MRPTTTPSRGGFGPAIRRRLRWAALLLVLALGLSAWVVVLTWPRPRPDPDRLRELVQADLEAGQFDRAADLLGRLDRLGPRTVEDWMLRARVAIARGQTEEALAALARVPDDHPNATEARFRRGQLELRRGRTRAAEAAFLHALRLYPHLAHPPRELVSIYRMQLRRAD